MKHTFKFLLLFVAAIGLVACSSKNEFEKLDRDPVVEMPDDTPVQEDSKKEDITEGDQQVDDSDEIDRNKEASIIYQNEVFKDVVVEDGGDQITISGKAQVFEGIFQYKLSEGEAVLIEANYQTEGAPAWGEFTITFEKDLISENDAVFKLFVYSAKDGSEINILDIPIEK